MEKLFTISNIILFITCAILLFVVIKNNAIKNFLGAFNNREEGDSGRKWTAFGFAILASYLHYQGFRDRILSTTINSDKSVITTYHSYIDHDNIITLCLIDVCVTLLALALIKTDDIPFLNKGSRTIIEQEKSSESKTTTTEEVK